MEEVGSGSNGLDAVVPAAQRKELIPSSRNQATVHRTVAFDCSSPYRGSQIKNAIRMDGRSWWNLERTRSQFVLWTNCKEPAGPLPAGQPPTGVLHLIVRVLIEADKK